MQGVSVLRPSRPYYPCISPATVAGPRLRAAGGRRALWARAELNRDRAQGGGPPQQANYPPWQDMRRTYDFAPPPPGPPPPGPPLPPQPPPQKKGIDELTKALIGAAFVVGLGTGVFVDSEVNLQPTSVASTAILDMRTPNSELCLANGYSAMVFDQRIFVSFNPFNVYVAQPAVKPGCVLRQANVNVLEKRKLLTTNEVDACKRSMNFWAFVGELDKSPEVSCVYHSEEAENQYLQNPNKLTTMMGPAGAPAPPGGDAAGGGKGAPPPGMR